MSELVDPPAPDAEPAVARVRPLVLLAEDSATQAAWIARVLREAGYQVTVAADGREALEQARAVHPAVIVSDVEMPELDGFELCRAVKLDPALRSVPFLILTQRDRASDLVRALEVGADNYLTKPIDPRQVVVRIDRILGDVGAWRARAAGSRSRPPLDPDDVVLSLERSQVTELLMATAEKLEGEIGVLGELGARLTMVQDPGELVALAALRTRELADADIAWIALRVEGAWRLEAVSGATPSGEPFRAGVPLEDEFQLDAAQLVPRRPHQLRHRDVDGRADGPARRYGLTETYAWPLISEEELLGVLGISFASPHALTASERHRFAHLADQAAVGIQNARRFERERQLRQQLEEAYAAEKEAHKNALFMLAAAVEARDGLTGAHLRRVGAYAALLARELGLDAEFVEQIGYSSMLHDVGKLLVPDAILGKPGRLSDAEWVEMRRHPAHGVQILGSQPFFAMARDISLAHHERWDGTGYPAGLGGDAIPLAARITSVADVFDALTTRRHYKEAWTADEALAEILELRGKAFDPAIVEAFVRLFERGEIERLQRSIGDVGRWPGAREEVEAEAAESAVPDQGSGAGR